jgi:outer membrane receptor protein involved in Fe transport
LIITSRLIVSGGLRIDRWQNFRAFSASRSLLNALSTFSVFPNRSESALSPRVGVLYRITNNISLSASGSTGFRQPTLNELYRAFRVGNVLTLANDSLIAERATNGEAGVIVSAFQRRLFARGNIFCTENSRTVANVTFSVTPTLITRQRQNLGRTRACGVEVDAQFSPTKEISFSGGYQFVDSRVVSFPANTSLEGLRVPQVARHQFTFQTVYANPKVIEAALQFRIGGRQFDDDQNLLVLRSYSTVDAIVSRALSSSLKIFAAAENLFDSKIESGRTPVLTLAGQRTFRIGVRVRLGEK